MAGTGLPIPNVGGVQAQPGNVIDGDKLSSARAWASIAQTGASLAKDGADALAVANHQQQVGYYAELDTEITRKRIDLQNAHKDDPQAFDAAWRGYSEGKIGEVADWAVPHAKRLLGSQGNSAYASLSNQKIATDQRLANDKYTALVDLAQNDVLAKAMAGNLDPATMADYEEKVRTGVTSRFIAPEEAERRIVALKSMATVYASRGRVKDAYGNGDAASANRLVDDIVRDDKLTGLSPETRFALGNRLKADIHAWDAERRANIEPVKLEAQAILSARKNGVTFDQGRIDATVQRFQRFGGVAEAASFLAELQHVEATAFLQQLPPQQAAAWIESYKDARGFGVPQGPVRSAIEAAAAQTGVPLDYMLATARRESRFNPNAKADTSSATGLYQITDATWRGLQAKYGAQYGLTDRADPQQNAVAAALLTKDNEAALTEAGLPVTNATRYLAHFAGAQGAVKLLTADPAASAARLLPGAAEANRAIFYNADGSARSVGQVVARLGGGGVSTIPATPSDIRFMGEATAALSKRVQDETTAINAEMDKGVLPSQDRLNALLVSARTANNAAALEEVAKTAANWQFRREFGRNPGPDDVAAIADMRRRAATTGLNESDAARLHTAEATLAAQQKGLKDDPLRYTVTANAETAGLPPPAPLNVDDRTAFQDGLRLRAAWAQLGATQYRQGAMPALQESDVQQLRAVLESADYRIKARIFADITAAIPDAQTRAATFGKIAAGADAVDALAGAMWTRSPDLAESIMRGQAAMKADERNNPLRKEGGKSEFVDALDKAMPTTAFALEHRQNPGGAYVTMKAAVAARYADLTARDPSGSKEFSETRLQQAVTDVTGGVVKHNGGALVAPRPGMTQVQFDAIMAGIKDSDVPGVTTLSGTPITAAYLRTNARLESVADGRYLVQVGNDPARPQYAVYGAETGFPAAFIIDLRDRAPGQTPRQGSLARMREAARAGVGPIGPLE